MTTQTSFHAAIILAAFVATLAITSRTATAEDGQTPQYYELRVYTTKSEEQQKRINDYWQNAAVPAYNRLGIKPIGVFSELEDSPTSKIYVLIPFNSPKDYADMPAVLAANSQYKEAAAGYLEHTKADPAYERFESSLLVAFDGMKKLALPPSSAEKKPWIFELRTYLSPSEGKGNNKVKMFNDGEITTMQEVGLSPVFFAQTVVGSQMPNLVYMVSGPDRDEHKKNWKAFQGAPAWLKLKADPQYKDNMTGIINVFLKRTPASQI